MSVIPEDKDLQPQFSWSSSSIFHSLYYVIFMFVASLCSIQLFIGVKYTMFNVRIEIYSTNYLGVSGNLQAKKRHIFINKYTKAIPRFAETISTTETF